MTGEEMLGWRRERFRRDERIVERKGKLPFLTISIERGAFQMKDVVCEGGIQSKVSMQEGCNMNK